MSNTETEKTVDAAGAVASLTPEMVDMIGQLEIRARRSIALTLAEFDNRVPTPWVIQTYLNELAVLLITVAVGGEGMTQDKCIELFDQMTNASKEVLLKQKFDSIIADVKRSMEEVRARLEAEKEAQQA